MLEAVVEQEHLGRARRFHFEDAPPQAHPVGPDAEGDVRQAPGQQDGLVAHHLRGVFRHLAQSVDHQGRTHATPVAAGQDGHVHPSLPQPPRQADDHRGLARAPHGEIPHAEHPRRQALAAQPAAAVGRGSQAEKDPVEELERPEQPSQPGGPLHAGTPCRSPTNSPSRAAQRAAAPRSRSTTCRAASPARWQAAGSPSSAASRIPSSELECTR